MLHHATTYIFLAIILAFTTSAGGVDSGIDLLESLQLHNTSRQGVSTIPGPQKLRPAFYLQGDHRDLKLPQSVFLKAVQLLRHNPEFTFSASLRQEVANSGSIISFSHGFNRYLELQSSGRKDEIRLHYTSQLDDLVHVEAFPYRLADNSWHKVAVSVSGTQVELLVDCHPLYRRLLQRTPDTNFTLPQLTLWVGQRNNRHSFFKGVLQDVRLISGPHGYLNQCPQLDAGCPTCGQFTTLQHTVEQLNKRLHLLTDKLLAAEGRISKLEECDCRKSCGVNGTEHQDGASWQIGCDMCRCKRGEVRCQPVHCPKTTCKYPVIKPGECCPTCLKKCYHMKTLYDHGERTSPKACFECKCEDGSMECKQKDPNVICPPLPCPSSQQFSVPGECCKFCPGVDYCGKSHMCHVNATCINLTTTYACHCNNGYQGDGINCYDVDECKLKGGLEGNHCHMNTRCVNTQGSYVCECLPGHRRIDKFNCAELDECATNQHKCDPHADCVNTLGSYHCICQNGYTGDGYSCSPTCESPCLNGGKCVSPGVCSCRRGYQGANCEQDLDECATDLHGCHPTSICVNMPGWYYCKCKAGYRSILHDGTLGTTCQDLDECQEGTHTCHPGATCVNTEGGFHCVCPAATDSTQQQPCSLNCMFEGIEVANNAVVAPAGQPCRSCKCADGVVTCSDTKCDCSKRGASRDRCCPQCDPRAACTHQELRHVVFTSGERWIYQCQTCECLFGEIDCWSLECPPVTCSSPVLAPGDCCPRCENDPCALDPFDNSSRVADSRGQPCTVSGKLYHSGSSWGDPEDRCTSCSCKDGRLCCSFDVRCSTLGSNGVVISENDGGSGSYVVKPVANISAQVDGGEKEDKGRHHENGSIDTGHQKLFGDDSPTDKFSYSVPDRLQNEESASAAVNNNTSSQDEYNNETTSSVQKVEKDKNRYAVPMENFSSTVKLSDEMSMRKSEEALASESYNPFEHRKLENPTTFSGALAHLLKGSLGSGILAMPMAFKNGGLALGLVGTIIVGFICAYCVQMLVKCSHILSKRSMVPSLTFAGTAETAFETGPRSLRKFSTIASYTAKSMLFLTYFGACCVYVVFTALSISQVVEYHLKSGIDIRFYILMLWIPLILICLVRELKNLVPFSVVANLFIIASFAITLYYMFTDIPEIETRNLVAPWQRIPLFFSTVIFAMEGIGTVMPIENHMKNPERFLSCCGVLPIAMSVVVILYGVIGFFGYLKFGEDTAGSVTLNLPIEDVLAQIVKILIALAIFFTYALQFYVPTSIIWEMIQHKFPPHKQIYYNYALRITTVTGTVILAAAVPNLGPIISLVGAVCFSILGLLLPAIIDLVTHWEIGLGPFKWIFIKDVLIMIIAVSALLAGSYTSMLDVIETYA